MVTGEVLDTAGGSEAHIIPNALGGRLAPKWLLTREANNLLNERVDLPFVQALSPLASLLNVKRQRGSNPPAVLVRKSGERVMRSPDGKLTVLAPTYKVEREGDRVKLYLRASTRKQIQHLLARARSEFPKLCDTDLSATVEPVEERLNDAHFTVGLGPNPWFRWAYVAAHLLAAHVIGRVGEGFARQMSALIASEDHIPEGVFYWSADEAWVATDRDTHHLAGLLPSEPGGECLAVLEVFGLPAVAVRISGCTLTLPWFHAVDPIAGSVFVPDIRRGTMLSLPREATHAWDGDALVSVLRSRMARLGAAITRLNRIAFADRVIREVLGRRSEGDLITEDDIWEIAARVAEALVLSGQIRSSRPSADEPVP